MKKDFSILIMVAILASGVPLIYAETTSSSPSSTTTTTTTSEKTFKHKMDGKMEDFYKDLNLTEDQKKALDANKAQHREKSKLTNQAIKDKMDLMQVELEKDQLNMEKIGQIKSEIKVLQSEQLDSRMDSVLEVRKILTPEQFKKFMGHMSENKEHFKHKNKEHK
ncbi:MAG: Spy/CpxP family protein refolding chaperone [Candidatus Omnitrophica bacterium]|nr:Spy/CpxP family protein refolding chaperone [Candidatus Omnitrophota bacterium]